MPLSATQAEHIGRHCRISPYLYQERRFPRRAQPWGPLARARRPCRHDLHDQSGSFVRLVARAAVFLAPDRPARGRRVKGVPYGPSHAIGFADPRPADPSPGFRAYEEDGER